MMLADVSVLLSAFRPDSQRHGICDSWLRSVIDGSAAFGLSRQVLSSVLRLATNSRVFNQPSQLGQAVDFCNAMLEQPHCILVEPQSGHWGIFERLLREGSVKGDLVSDAWLAALSMEAGCEWITLDKDFRRFKGLKWRLLS